MHRNVLQLHKYLLDHDIENGELSPCAAAAATPTATAKIEKGSSSCSNTSR